MKKKLMQKLGPLPIWAWVLLAVGAGIVYRWYKLKHPDQPDNSGDTTDDSYYQGIYGTGIGQNAFQTDSAGTPPVSPPPPPKLIGPRNVPPYPIVGHGDGGPGFLGPPIHPPGGGPGFLGPPIHGGGDPISTAGGGLRIPPYEPGGGGVSDTQAVERAVAAHPLASLGVEGSDGHAHLTPAASPSPVQEHETNLIVFDHSRRRRNHSPGIKTEGNHPHEPEIPPHRVSA